MIKTITTVKRPITCTHTVATFLPYTLPATKTGNSTIIDSNGTYTASFPTLADATKAASDENYYIRKIAKS